jgi:uncharacterized protein (DUF1015 family)
MALVRPFPALRPEANVAAEVAAVPYDVVSTEEARALAADAPLSFLHVTRPEIDLSPGTESHEPAAYERARTNLTALRQAAPLVIDHEPSLYVYRLRDGDHVQTGLAGCYSLDEYDRGAIKKHERTRPDKEDDRTKHMVAIEAQTGVVFLTYRQIEAIDSVVDEVCETPPLFDFEAVDGIRHTIWRTAEHATRRLVEGFVDVQALYIADGHHRAASAARAREALGGSVSDETVPAERDFFLAVAFPDQQTRILPYNRTLSDLAGATPDQFLQSLSTRLEVVPTLETTPQKGSVSMYLGGRWYRVGLAAGQNETDVDPVDALDVSLLQHWVLGPILQVADIRTDPRVHFVGGVRGTDELERLVDSGQAAVAFSMAAVTVAELLAIADAGAIMAPKSTWFEPKLRDGLLIHLI